MAALAALLLAVLTALPWGVGGDGHARADVRNPTGVALIIGNKNYEAVGEVKYAHRDAEAFRRYVIDVLGFDPFNVRVLKDGSFGKLRSELGIEGEHGLVHRYVERYSRQNNGEAVSDVVVFYSGHGMPSLDRNKPGTFLLPVDADPHNAALNGYSTDELYRVLAALPARSVSVFLDACFSGSNGNNEQLVDASFSPVSIQPLPDNVSENMVVFTAAKAEQVAFWNHSAEHGMFTHLLMNALYGEGDQDGDNQVTTKEVKAYLDKHLWRLALERFSKEQDADLVDGTQGATVHASAPAGGAFPPRPDIGDVDPDTKKDDTKGGGKIGNLKGGDDGDSTGDEDEHKKIKGNVVGDKGEGTEGGVGKDEDPNQVKLGDGSSMALSDWVELAALRLEDEEYLKLLEEASGYIGKHGTATTAIVDIGNQAASKLTADIPVGTKEEAQAALARIEKIEKDVGDHPALLRVLVQAHRLLGDHSNEMKAYGRWLKAVPEKPHDEKTKNERKEMLTAQWRLRGKIAKIEEFSELLGRPPSADFVEESVGWTDLHYAALLNMPVVVEVLIDRMAADIRLKTDSPPFGDALKQTLAKLGHGEEFKNWNADGETPLMIAAVANARAAAEALIAAGADISAKDSISDMTPLHYAARWNARETAELLLDRDADIEANNGSTPLHHAASKDARETAELLLAKGADIEARDTDGDTPLHEAAYNNARETAELLLDRDADIEAKNDNGETPLHYTAWNNARETAKFLLDRGADIEAKKENGSTPLHLAAWKNARETAELLLDRDADIEAKNNNGSTPLNYAAFNNAREVAELLLDRRADINAKDDDGDTALHDAAWNNARETAEFLLDRGADIEAKQIDGDTPLHLAAWKNARETAKILLDRDADINATNTDGETPLDYAIGEGHAEMQEALRDRGGLTGEEEREARKKDERARLFADLGTEHLKRPFSADAVEDSIGWTDLHFAALLNLPGVAEALIDEGMEADVRLKMGTQFASGALKQSLAKLGHRGTLENWGAGGRTPLMIAAATNASEAAKALIDRGADSKGKDTSDNTPLHFAARANAQETAALLVAKDANVNAKNIAGNTPLHEAAWKDAQEMVAWLVEQDADINAINGNGLTPLDRATAESHAEVKETLHGLGGRTGPEVKEEGQRVARATEILGRSFSADAVEESVGWTDLHYAALLDLPGVVKSLTDEGMEADVRLKTGSPPFGDALKQTLAKLGRGKIFEHYFANYMADGETPLMIAAYVNARKAAEALIAAGANSKAKGDTGSSVLHYAAFGDARETAELLVAQGADVKATDNDGNTPLHDAASKDARETAELLLDRDADIEAKSNNGSTPLHWAAWNDARETAELLLDRDADIEARQTNGDTPLHLAAYKDARETAELLLAKGADIEAKNGVGNTPLHDAASKDARETAELLLDRDADIEAKNNNGSTPLHTAAWNNARETAELLLDRDADIEARQTNGDTPLHLAAYKDARETAELLLAKGADIEAKNGVGNTPLHYTAWDNARDVAELLLDRDAAINATNTDGYTPLDSAIGNGDAEMQEALRDRGGLTGEEEREARKKEEKAKLLDDLGNEHLGRPFSADTVEESVGWTDLHYAALLDLPGVVEALIDEGMEADVRLERGSRSPGDALKQTLARLGHGETFKGWRSGSKTPLMIAARVDARAAVKSLISRGADINAKDTSDLTPLHEAAWTNARKTAEWLISQGADVKAINFRHVTPLHLAARTNAREIAERLTARGAEVNAKDNAGRTPLHAAAESNARETAVWLIAKGALVNAKDGYGDTPLHAAARANAWQTAVLLRPSRTDIDARDLGDRTPLHEAVLTNSLEMAGWLVARGADVNARDHVGKTPLDRAVELGRADMERMLSDNGGLTAQEEKKARDRARLLASSGNRHLGRPFSADKRDDSVGWTDLHYAALLNLPRVVEALIDEGMAVDVRLTGRLSYGSELMRKLGSLGFGRNITGSLADGHTPLMLAAYADAHGAAAALIARGADVNGQDKNGLTPLHHAAKGSARETANLLVRRDAKINANDLARNTPLHYAAQRNAREVAELLVAGGATIDATNSKGETPLHWAVRRGARGMAKWLIDRDADIEAKRDGGDTPLHSAAVLALSVTAEWLVGQGADVNATNKIGETPLDHAIASGSALTEATLRRLDGLTGREIRERAERETQPNEGTPRTFRDRDCDECPLMVKVPAGEFMMGAPKWEPESHLSQMPQHWVTIPAPFAVSKYEVTVDEYRHFVKDTRRRTEGGCGNWISRSKKWQQLPHRRWNSPGFAETQTGKHPVVCVSWEDAQAYAKWLSRKTNRMYRLLTEAEWEYAARAGTTGPFHFGETISTDLANYDGDFIYNNSPKGEYRKKTVEVGIFQENDFGLHDMHGNVWEWVEDCYNVGYTGAPDDGSAWKSGECSERVLRGGSWLVKPKNLRSANRGRKAPDFRSYIYGFRVARSLPQASSEEQRERDRSGHELPHCDECPEMVEVPAGEFTMGSPPSEEGRYSNEGPQRPVAIPKPFAVGKHEVTRGQFARFVEATGHSTRDECWTDEDGKWESRSGRTWQKPGIEQEERDPVVCVSWHDAWAYLTWLAQKTGRPYRLLSEAEWEYAARAMTTGPFHFGSTISTNQANFKGNGESDGSGGREVYRERTVPVSWFPPNAFGLRNVHGNVWEWVEDCWHKSYAGAPPDGEAWTSGDDCHRKVLRGGSWNSIPQNLRSAFRASDFSGSRSNNRGFRVALTLDR